MEHVPDATMRFVWGVASPTISRKIVSQSLMMPWKLTSMVLRIRHKSQIALSAVSLSRRRKEAATTWSAQNASISFVGSVEWNTQITILIATTYSGAKASNSPSPSLVARWYYGLCSTCSQSRSLYFSTQFMCYCVVLSTHSTCPGSGVGSVSVKSSAWGSIEDVLAA